MIAIEEIRRAREVLDGTTIRTPLVRLDADADAEIWLKLEVLQPVRSFKLRGAGNAILQASDAELAGGVLTASAGNMAQGVAYAARLRGVPATIVVPEHAPQTKIDAIERYGGRVIRVPVRGVVAGARDRPLRRSRRPLRPPGRQRAGDGGERDDRARAARAERRLRHRRRAVRRRRAADRDRERGQGASGPSVRFFAAEPETGAPVAATLAAGEADGGRVHAVVRRRLGQPRADPARLGAGVASCSTARSRCRSTRWPPRCG